MNFIKHTPAMSGLLAAFASTAGADTLLEENFDVAKPGSAPPASTFAVKGINRKGGHRVVITDEQASPFGGRQSLVVDDPDDAVTAKGPGVTVSFRPSSGPVTIRFDYMVPEGQGANGPALLLSGGRASAMRLNLFGREGKIDSRYGGGAGFKVAPGVWHRVELKLSAIRPGAGGESFDISVTLWDKAAARPGQAMTGTGWNFNKEADIASYGSMSFEPVAVSKGQPDSKGRFYLDNILVSGEPAAGAAAPVAPATATQEAAAQAQEVAAVIEPPVLIDTDFAIADKAVNFVSENKSITGVLPKGWADDSTFQSGIKIEYKPVELDGVKGLRAEKTSSGTQIQMRHELPNFAGGSIYRLELTGRNPSQMGVKFGIRDRGGPYKWHWVTSPNWGDEWQTRAVDFQLPRSSKPVTFPHRGHGRRRSRPQENQAHAPHPRGNPGRH
jgi:hypothetical protein